MAGSLEDVLAATLPWSKARLSEIVEALGNSANGGESVWLGKMPPVPPKQREGPYITFLAFVRVGVNFLLSRFTEEVLDSYGIRLGNLVPNSIVMLATFAYLCEALVGVQPYVELFAKRIGLGAPRSKAGASAGARDAPGASGFGTAPSSSLPE